MASGELRSLNLYSLDIPLEFAENADQLVEPISASIVLQALGPIGRDTVLRLALARGMRQLFEDAGYDASNLDFPLVFSADYGPPRLTTVANPGGTVAAPFDDDIPF